MLGSCCLKCRSHVSTSTLIQGDVGPAPKCELYKCQDLSSSLSTHIKTLSMVDVLGIPALERWGHVALWGSLAIHSACLNEQVPGWRESLSQKENNNNTQDLKGDSI